MVDTTIEEERNNNTTAGHGKSTGEASTAADDVQRQHK